MAPLALRVADPIGQIVGVAVVAFTTTVLDTTRLTAAVEVQMPVKPVTVYVVLVVGVETTVAEKGPPVRKTFGLQV